MVVVYFVNENGTSMTLSFKPKCFIPYSDTLAFVCLFHIAMVRFAGFAEFSHHQATTTARIPILMTNSTCPLVTRPC